MDAAGRHRRAGELFLAALDRAAAERASWLDEQCRDDVELRAAVDQLLGQAGQPSPLDHPALGADVDDLVARGGRLPERVGPYRVLGLLGEGSTGRVYRAVQENPRRELALKVLRAGLADERMARRLALEADILARMAHPGVAHVYATGITGGPAGPVPWLALEIVEGPDLTTWADERDLDLRQRVELLAAVCDAVHHAHLRGVIHRDLKADNILVAPDGQPKVLDFGVARAAVGDTAATTLVSAPGDLVGTLATMSPEQVGAHPEDVDIRADVYALGVLAFQLISGRLPHDLAGLSVAEAVRVIAEERAPPLVRAGRRVGGDLQTIVSTALQKDRGRRYASAAQLHADLGRWLSGLPIAARREGRLRAALRFARRHPWFTSGLVLLVTALGAALLLQRAATRTAQQQSAELQRTLQAVGTWLASPAPGRWRGTETVADLMARAEEALPHFARGDLGLEGVLWSLVGRFHYHSSHLPASRRAAQHAYARGLDMQARAYGDADPRTLTALVEFASFLELVGDDQRAGALLDRFWPHAAAFDADDERRLDARALAARLAHRAGDDARALRQLQAVWKDAREALGDAHDITLGATMLAMHLGDGSCRDASLAALLARIEDGSADEQVVRVLFPLSTSLLRDAPDRALAIQHRALSAWADPRLALRRLYWDMYADNLTAVGRLDEATCVLRESLAILEGSAGPDSRQALDARRQLADVLGLQGRLDDAEGHQRLVLARLPEPPGASLDLREKATLGLARCLHRRGAHAEAEQHLHALDALLARAHEDDADARRATLELLHRVIAAHRRARGEAPVVEEHEPR